MAERRNSRSWGAAITMAGFVLLGILLLFALRNSATPWLGAIFVVIGAVWFLFRLLPSGKRVGRISAALSALILREVGDGETVQVMRPARLISWPAPWKGNKKERDPEAVGLALTQRRLYLLPLRYGGFLKSSPQVLDKRWSAIKGVRLRNLSETEFELEATLSFGGQVLTLGLPKDQTSRALLSRISVPAGSATELP